MAARARPTQILASLERCLVLQEPPSAWQTAPRRPEPAAEQARSATAVEVASLAPPEPHAPPMLARFKALGFPARRGNPNASSPATKPWVRIAARAWSATAAEVALPARREPHAPPIPARFKALGFPARRGRRNASPPAISRLVRAVAPASSATAAEAVWAARPERRAPPIPAKLRALGFPARLGNPNALLPAISPKVLAVVALAWSATAAEVVLLARREPLAPVPILARRKPLRFPARAGHRSASSLAISPPIPPAAADLVTATEPARHVRLPWYAADVWPGISSPAARRPGHWGLGTTAPDISNWRRRLAEATTP